MFTGVLYSFKFPWQCWFIHNIQQDAGGSTGCIWFILHMILLQTYHHVQGYTHAIISSYGASKLFLLLLLLLFLSQHAVEILRMRWFSSYTLHFNVVSFTLAGCRLSTRGSWSDTVKLHCLQAKQVITPVILIFSILLWIEVGECKLITIIYYIIIYIYFFFLHFCVLDTLWSRSECRKKVSCLHYSQMLIVDD